MDARELGLGHNLDENLTIRSGGRRSRGYGVFLAETDERPRSLKAFGKRLIERFHDRPLAVIGVRPKGALAWERFIVVRPRTVKGVLGAVRVAKLEVDVTSPTQHDAEVLASIAWQGDDAVAQERIDVGLDADRVTARFYKELAEHYQRLIGAVQEACDAESAVLAAIKSSVGPGDDPVQRVALRILTQLLFCWFLQRKGLLAERHDYLRTRFQLKKGLFYASELEPLFYDVLARPVERRMAGLPGAEIPFLNGGLFVRTYGDVSLPLPDEVFNLEDGLLAFLSRWTFTVAEDVPDETEVAVDPEMLGKVFENLISDDQAKRQGTVYTPRPVVHFMCREALVPWLSDRLSVDEAWARRLLVEDDALVAYNAEFGSEQTLSLARGIDESCASLSVLDPAVGSGAFLLGMLAEIVRLRSIAARGLRGHDPSPDDVVA